MRLVFFVSELGVVVNETIEGPQLRLEIVNMLADVV